MNRVLACSAALLATLSALPVLAATPTRVDGDFFTVAMPDKPETASSVVPFPSGNVVTRTWNSVDEGNVYAITATDYPAKYVASRPSEKLLDDARDGLIAQLKGVLASEKTVTLQGNSGTEFEITSENGRARARAVLVGNRVYTMIALDRSPDSEAAANRFLTSLRLKPASARLH